MSGAQVTNHIEDYCQLASAEVTELNIPPNNMLTNTGKKILTLFDLKP